MPYFSRVLRLFFFKITFLFNCYVGNSGGAMDFGEIDLLI